MSSLPKIALFCEGPDDQAFLRGLQLHGLLPEGLEVKGRRKGGESTLIGDTLALASPFGGVGARAIALRDFDEFSSEALGRWFEAQAKQEATRLDASVQVSQARINERVWQISLQKGERVHVLVVVGVGRPHDEPFRQRYGIASHAIDDYVIELVLQERIYNGLIGQFSDVPYAKALEKMDEVPALLRKNGLVVNQSKRLSHLLRGITGFRAAPATFIDEAFRKAQEVGLSQAEVRSFVQPLVDDLVAAVRVLRPSIDTTT